MKKAIVFLLCVLLFIGGNMIYASDTGTDYYVSSSSGSDGNDGHGESTPYKTFEKINALHLSAGDRVLLKRGDVFNERLVINGSGTADNWIYVGAYGDLNEPAPKIALNNDRNDICILATDLNGGKTSAHSLNYIHIDGLKIADSCMGIYFRYAVSENNVGIKVTDCEFENINCPELMNEALTDLSFLSQPKADLPTFSGGVYSETGGGAYEYIWPAAINIGGRPAIAMASSTVEGKCKPCTKVSGITVSRVSFDGCICGIGSNAYAIHYGWGKENICFEYAKNWKLSDLTAINTMTTLNIDSADFGYDGSDSSEWGIFSNICCLSGMSDASMSSGTTCVLISTTRNVLFKDSCFNDCHNNGQPDGCGFDFERENHNITLKNCIIANNEGQGVLMMQTTGDNQITGTKTDSPNSNCTLDNCLFYNNMRRVYNDNYRYDFTVFNNDNTDISLVNCAFYFREKTSGGAEAFINTSTQSKFSFQPAGKVKKGITVTNPSYTRDNSLPTLEQAVSDKGLTASMTAALPQAKTVSIIPSPVTTDAQTQISTDTAAKQEENKPEKVNVIPYIAAGAVLAAVIAVAVIFIVKKKGK